MLIFTLCTTDKTVDIAIRDVAYLLVPDYKSSIGASFTPYSLYIAYFKSAYAGGSERGCGGVISRLKLA